MSPLPAVFLGLGTISMRASIGTGASIAFAAAMA